MGIHETCPPWKVQDLAANILAHGNRKTFDKIEVNGCNADVSRMLGGLASAATFLTMTQIHCEHKFSFPTICGIGVSSLAVSLIGVAGASSGIYLTCKAGQGDFMKELKLS